MPSAIGKSNAAPIFRRSAGARLTVTRFGGNGKPELRIAVRTRSRLSRTVASGKPTIVTPGKPGETSTSTDTGTASTPDTAAAAMRASTSPVEQVFSQRQPLVFSTTGERVLRLLQL